MSGTWAREAAADSRWAPKALKAFRAAVASRGGGQIGGGTVGAAGVVGIGEVGLAVGSGWSYCDKSSKSATAGEPAYGGAGVD